MMQRGQCRPAESTKNTRGDSGVCVCVCRSEYWSGGWQAVWQGQFQRKKRQSQFARFAPIDEIAFSSFYYFTGLQNGSPLIEVPECQQCHAKPCDRHWVAIRSANGFLITFLVKRYLLVLNYSSQIAIFLYIFFSQIFLQFTWNKFKTPIDRCASDRCDLFWAKNETNCQEEQASICSNSIRK